MSNHLPLLQPEERVLSTLNADGSRRWLNPRLVKGHFWAWRRIVAYALIAIFILIPHLRFNELPVFQIDVSAFRLILLGNIFLPTDAPLLAFMMIALFISIFLVTALFGRIWCGWACPQTVYLEFLFRPLEKLFERRRFRSLPAELRGLLKYLAYLLAALLVAHTFLAYFVGTDALFDWIRQPPWEHPTSFMIMLVTTGLMLFNFCYFREQTCIVACPYGRLQSVMLDRDSLIISYDQERGEPRGRTDVSGDCVACAACVQVCPTGIDIRDGLQLECVGCAQCIDACDAVMTKLNRPTGLIRYASEANPRSARTRWIRPRVILYAGAFTGALIGFGFRFAGVQPVRAQLTRGLGSPYVALADGTAQNAVQLQLYNRSNEDRTFTLTMLAPTGSTVQYDETALTLAPGMKINETILINIPADAIATGRTQAEIQLADQSGFASELKCIVYGPRVSKE